MKIHFLLPAFNEEANITGQIAKLTSLVQQLGADHCVWVINDASTDTTQQLVEELAEKDDRIRLKNHTKNGGPGVAFKTGFAGILKEAADDDLIISMDADNTHSEHTVKMMLARAAEGYEMVIASVFASGGMLIGVPFLRFLLTIACNMCYRLLFPVSGIKEYTGFYRCYRVGSLRKAFDRFAETNEELLTAKGFATAAEILIKLRRVPLFMTEVPMLVRYDKKGGKSKLKICKTTMEHLHIIKDNLFRRHIV